MKDSILIIDDSMVARKQVALAIEALGYHAIEAEDGTNGWNQLEQRQNDILLVILDWNMPGLSGIEVLRKIRSDQRFRSIPVMMVTTETERENMIEAVRAGATQYVMKPYTHEDLQIKVLQCLGMNP